MARSSWEMQGGRVCLGTSVQLQLVHVLLDPVLLGVGADFTALLCDKPVGCREISFRWESTEGEPCPKPSLSRGSAEFGHAAHHAHHTGSDVPTVMCAEPMDHHPAPLGPPSLLSPGPTSIPCHLKRGLSLSGSSAQRESPPPPWRRGLTRWLAGSRGCWSHSTPSRSCGAAAGRRR